MVQKRLSEVAKKRVKAGRLLVPRKSCAEVALAVVVARQTVYTSKQLLDEGSIVALREVPELGSPAQLDERQLVTVRATLLQSPPAAVRAGPEPRRYLWAWLKRHALVNYCPNEIGAQRAGHLSIGFVSTALFDTLPYTVRTLRMSAPEVEP